MTARDQPVGRQFWSLLHQLGAVPGLFEEQRIHLLSQAASDLNLTLSSTKIRRNGLSPSCMRACSLSERGRALRSG